MQQLVSRQRSREQKTDRLMNTLLVPENEQDKYELIEQIGAGGFGEVSKVTERTSANSFAMKKVQLDPAGNDNKYILREVKHLLELSEHTNIVFVQDIFRGIGNKLVIIMELCDCDLAGFLRLKLNRAEAIGLNVLQQCARGLTFLHSRKPIIIHRDIKPQNILIKHDGENIIVKITDFGISSSVDTQDIIYSVGTTSGSVRTTHGGGTVSFMAPEFFAATDPMKALQELVCVDASVDVFALGLVYAYVIDWNEPDNDYSKSAHNKHLRSYIHPFPANTRHRNKVACRYLFIGVRLMPQLRR